MTSEEYIKELKDLKSIALKNGDITLAVEVLERISKAEQRGESTEIGQKIVNVSLLDIDRRVTRLEEKIGK